jgi:hypothetical protein
MDPGYPSIVAFGNPEDGFEYVGPFASHDAAEAYGLRHCGLWSDWWVITLQAPAKEGM